MMNRSYSRLIKLKTFEERFQYLKIPGIVGNETFGSHRYLNQNLYRSSDWKKIRDKVIIRDNGCDLAMNGYEIYDRIYIHHINPLTIQDIDEQNYDKIFSMNNLVCVSYDTHQAIHFSDESLLPKLPIERKPGDTKLW